jgi:enoyl-CoA hydratase/carnithine racemase
MGTPTSCASGSTASWATDIARSPRQDDLVTTDPHGDRIWPDLATLTCELHPTAVARDDGSSTRILVVRLTNPAGDLLDTSTFADLDTLGRRLAAERGVGGVVVTGPRPGVFAPHFRLGEIADGAEALGRPVPYALARTAYLGVRGLSRVTAVRDRLLASPAAGIAELVRTHGALTRLGAIPQVVVAAIDGDALAGGCELALACDLRVMAEGDGRIGLVEITAAIAPGAGGTQRLARAVGAARARSMMLRATVLDAGAAHAIGLVDEVCTSAEVLDLALSVAAEVARRSPDAVAAVKRSLQGGTPMREGLAVEGASFVSTASRPAAIARLRAFARGSDERGTTTPWRDRSWLS